MRYLIVGLGSIGRRHLRNLLALGVIGECLAQAYFRTKHKPACVIEEQVVRDKRWSALILRAGWSV